MSDWRSYWPLNKLLLVVLRDMPVISILRLVSNIILGINRLFSNFQKVIEPCLKLLVKAVHLHREDRFLRVNHNLSSSNWQRFCTSC